MSESAPTPSAARTRGIVAAAALLALVAVAGLLRPAPTAREIIDDARAAHGSARLDTRGFAFDFRGTPYRVSALGGPRTMARTRTLPDSLGGARVTETVRADGTVTRALAAGGAPTVLPPDEAARVATSIGAVVYFAAFPHGLADASVRLRRLPDDRLRGRRVRTVEVTFDSTGGRSWTDRYIVWVDAERATVDAFAYDYEDGDGETRLRLVTRAWTAGGVRFQNYATFTDDDMKGRIERYLTRIGTPTLRAVSDVDLDDVTVGS